MDGVAFLLDVDNTLLDNDRLKADLAARIESEIGTKRARRFWDIYEEVRSEASFVDYPATVSRWAAESQDQPGGERLMAVLDHVPFRDYLYPLALDTIAYLQTMGTVAIVSDGDQVFQALKIQRSGLAESVHGNVLITVHKERELKRVFARFPARHYVVVDDKPSILSALGRECPATFTTILVMQGRYAAQPARDLKPDHVVNSIGELLSLPPATFAAQSA
jgi:FMN phosphatase YigB (HAD superfamily)